MSRRRLPRRGLAPAAVACAIVVLAAQNPAHRGEPSSTSLVTAASTACPAPGYGVRHSAPGSGKTVALTFDDGPGANTTAILQILEDAGITATFFNIGVNERADPATEQAEYTQQFLLGNHTWSHADMATLSAAAQAAQIDRESAQQQATTGVAPCLFRPPNGSYDAATLSVAQARRLSVWNWSVDTEDWKAGNSASAFWVNRIIGRAEAGGSQAHPVVLLHNSPGGDAATVAALPKIIRYYRDHGYAFVDLAGRTADRPIAGDWDGNGTITPGVVRGNTWFLRNTNSPGPADVVFAFGGPGDRPVVGDWDGNGTWTPGVVRGSRWFLRNANTTGPGTVVFHYGGPLDRVIAGDWDGDGTFTPGVVRGSTWLLRNSNTSGSATMSFSYGGPSDRVITGDWDGNGTFTPGLVRNGRWYLRNANSAGPGTAVFSYGGPVDRPLAGDWNGDGTFTPAVVRGTRWYERNANTAGPGTTTFAFGPSNP